jgi:hypothetical protein
MALRTMSAPRALGELGGRGGAGQHLDAAQPGGRQGAAQDVGCGAVGHRDPPDAVAADLLQQQRDVAAARGEAGDGEAVGVGVEQVERLRAHGAGGAQHEHGSGVHHRPSSSRPSCATM